jgi:hypothetical protein
LRFPDDKRFAFSILDDTDDSTLENVSPVYALLEELGFRTTKTVWPVDCPEGSRIYYAADTLDRPDYLEFTRRLESVGFEIASHGATMESSTRPRTMASLELLRARFQREIRLYANHGQNRENLYWGAQRFQLPILRWLLARLRPGSDAQGADVESPYFWGDLCRERFDYVRNFTFSDLDMLHCNPEMPYRLASTPFVPMWFSTTDAPDVVVFNRRVTREALERVERDGGVCIISTHLGKGFSADGRPDPEFEATLRWLATRPGWFVPVSTILDHMRAGGPNDRLLSPFAHLRLEFSFLLDQLKIRLRAIRGTSDR